MEPKKSKDFAKATAKQMDLPPSLVEDIASFYWSTIRRALTNLESSSVTVAGIGTFKIKPTMLPKRKAKYQSYIDNLDMSNMTFQKHAIYDIAKDRSEKLKAIEEELEAEKLRKQEVKKQRQEYVTNKNLEE